MKEFIKIKTRVGDQALERMTSFAEDLQSPFLSEDDELMLQEIVKDEQKQWQLQTTVCLN
jgi:hypothetical protein